MNPLIARVALAAAFAFTFASAASAGDNYPSRPITLVVPNAAGGPTDAIARSVGQRLSTRLGQPVLVDNRGGAGGMIAAEYVAHAKPDGYTLFLSTTGTLAINPAVYDKLRYDTLRDFVPIGLISTTSNVLVVRTGLNVKDVKELVALAKREPDKLTYGSSGIGASNHLAAEMFKSMTGAQIRHVPYKAAGAMSMDMHEGRIDMVFGPEGSAMRDLVQIGSGRALMVSGHARSTLFPDVPTAEEVGLKGYDMNIWFGLNAPAGTPAAVVDRLNKELNAVLAMPEMKKELAADGETPRPMTPKEYGDFLAQEIRKWAPIVKASGAKAP